jgi:hypothetical protein
MAQPGDAVNELLGLRNGCRTATMAVLRLHPEHHEFIRPRYRQIDKDREIGRPSAPPLPLKIFLDMGGVELQVPSSPDAADFALLPPCVQGLGMAVQ